MSDSPGPGPDNPDPLQAGDRELQWTRRYSPVVNTLIRPRLAAGGLAGRRIALVGPDPLLATTLTEAGARVAIATGLSGQLGEVVEMEPELIIDRDADLTDRIREEAPDRYRSLVGVSDATGAGTARLSELDRAAKLPFPAVGGEGRQHTSGQATIQAILRLTNLRLQGKCVALTAYDRLGSALAGTVSAMGGRVIVADDDPVACLAAHNDGHEIAPLEAAVGRADILIVLGAGRIGTAEIGALTDGTVIVNATSDDAFDSSALAAAASEVEEVRPGVTRHRLAAGTVFLLAMGKNVTTGSEPTIEVADLVAASHALACLLLVSGNLDPGVHHFPTDLQTAIAEAKLASLGIPPKVAPSGGSHE